MRLAFDATSLLGPRTGVGTFTAEVLGRLATRPDIDVTAFAVTWRGRGDFPGAVPAGVAAIARPLPARLMRAAWRHAELPPLEWIAGRFDAVHGPNFVVPPSRRAARLVTVHDL
ncbi:MAG: glycosyltransferase family 1 protein, partial [Acidimicrobiales bacterium]